MEAIHGASVNLQNYIAWDQGNGAFPPHEPTCSPWSGSEVLLQVLPAAEAKWVATRDIAFYGVAPLPVVVQPP